MDTDTAIFGDQFAQEIGRSLLAYFESKEFPNQLLRDSTLNSLYLKAQVHNIVNDKALSDVECYALIGPPSTHTTKEAENLFPFPKRRSGTSFLPEGLKSRPECAILLGEFSAYMAYTSQEGNDFHVRTFQMA